jgi:hypothetical protein
VLHSKRCRERKRLIICVYSKNHMKYINVLCAKKYKFLLMLRKAVCIVTTGFTGLCVALISMTGHHVRNSSVRL